MKSTEELLADKKKLYEMGEKLLDQDTRALLNNAFPTKYERTSLISYIAKKMGWTPKGTHFKLIHLKLPDLYYLKSDCDSAERRGVPWVAAFKDAMHLSKKYRK